MAFNNAINNSVLADTFNVASYFDVQADGVILTPGQPAFFAYTGGPVPFFTGDDSAVAAVFNQTAYNIGGYFNTSNDTFTALTGGRYFFSYTISLYDMDSAHNNLSINAVTDFNQYRLYTVNCYQVAAPPDPLTTLSLNGSFQLNLPVDSTVQIVVNVSGGTKTVGLSGDAFSPLTFFSGYFLG